MSVRAHRVVKVEYAPEASFNLYWDGKLVEFIEGHDGVWDRLNSDGCGQACIAVETLEEAISKNGELNLDEDTVKVLKEDIEAAKAEGEEYITYDFF
jgi:hypothetical protein